MKIMEIFSFILSKNSAGAQNVSSQLVFSEGMYRTEFLFFLLTIRSYYTIDWKLNKTSYN